MAENMVSLNLGSRPPITRPASTFPERADVYVCDKCGRDITKHLRPRMSHSAVPIGRERYQCLCGQEYLTGAREWDHLGNSERRRRIGESVILGVVFSALLSSLPGLLAYRFVRSAFGFREGAVAIGLAIAALPFALIQVAFWPSVVASMWRTRIGKS